MLPISTQTLVRFSPLQERLDQLRQPIEAEDETAAAERRRAAAALADQIAVEPQPVYLLAVPSHFQRAAFRRDLRSAGATYPGDGELYRALRADLAAVAPANLEDLLALVDEVEASAPGEVDLEAVQKLGDIVRLARVLGQRYAALEGDREYWIAVTPLIACRHFLHGWEGVDRPFVRTGTLTSDETLSVLDDGDLSAIGWKIMSLMRVSKAQEKNSGSSSRSPLGPRPTPTTQSTPPTVPSGNCLGSGTPETPVVS